MPNSSNRFSLCGLFLITLFAALTASAQSSAFTYQGKLTSGGTDGAGAFDFKFRLYDLAAGGAQQGAEIVRDDVAVTAGVFTVSLDFGNQFTPAGERWLEIEVRDGASNGSYTLLSPRQRISSSPFSVQTINAQFAVTAGNAQAVGGIPAANIVNTSDPRLTDARPPTAGSGNYVQNTTTQQPASNFNISGLGKAAVLDANTYNIQGFQFIGIGGSGNANIKVGIDAGGNIDNGFQNTFLGYRAGASNSTGGTNVFAGANAGFFNDNGTSNSLFGWSAGTRIVSGSRNSMFGFQAGNNTTAGDNAFFGADSGITNTVGNNLTLLGSGSNVSTNSLNNATAIGSKAVVSVSNALVLGSINGVNGATADTNVGIGTTAPTQRLHVVGNGLFSGNLTVNGTLTAALPAGSTSYIQNSTTQQTSTNFNIGGNGTANIFNAQTEYWLGGSRIMRSVGDSFMVGNQAGANTTAIWYNSFFGTRAGRDNSTGEGNSFFGKDAGLQNQTASGNSYFGENAGRNRIGNNNSVFGSTLPISSPLSTGDFNSFFGHRAGEMTMAGSLNTFLGTGAGFSNNSGSGNTFVGHDSGSNNLNGSFNTTLGEFANLGNNSLTNATAIGYRATAGQNNSLVLGSINGVNGATADTTVGIGTITPNPNSKLHVSGNIRVTNGGIFVANPNTLVITSPNGACWGITVGNTGTLATFPVNPCP